MKIETLPQPILIFDDKAVDGEIKCHGVIKKKILFDTRPDQRRIKQKNEHVDMR